MSHFYVIATPIGNLGDLSIRAVEVLRQCDLIYCEDTRSSSVLLKHYNIETPARSFHQHNEHKRVEELIGRVKRGEVIGLISDAGMPGISDPGFLAVRAARQENLPVTVIPGADALTTALVSSGLPCDRFQFEGFLPPKKGRQTRIKEIAGSEITTVIYESPHKLIRLLEMLREFCGEERWVAVVRELTKKFEETDRGMLGELTDRWKQKEKIRGEFVVVVAGKGYEE
ncbi:MAG: 16S rRNA (cytidine(1402)-2'-O)-methyltransferase [Balneolaceae bacterium]|nr:MAG: 16S rRNA (cytidine(1402)-2'-O)-methyltransferase [Balneolaceae bacterium]